MRPFETFEHTADIGLVARGRTLEEVFTHAAEGLVDIMVDPEGLHETTRLEVTVSAPDREALLVAWLNELLYLLDTRGLLPRQCRIIHLTETGLTAEIAGEAIDPQRHRIRRMVKAATYHGLHLAREDGRWEARVILDL